MVDILATMELFAEAITYALFPTAATVLFVSSCIWLISFAWKR